MFLAMVETALPRPLQSFQLLCTRCRASLHYVRQDRSQGVYEHHYYCHRCGQRHAAWCYEWEPDGMGCGARPRQ